ncbi:hypothetical protein GNI_152570 [Gregarina niphandrodes]|uniref:Proteasome activator Blm10 mid region domain-containing protein n=1 Tax=Gregarina niphandrodes TaxID=110365 RepID=A0A023B0C2_GRENI|nr:hypothetical protein GNI_152570 [Gregarina niphandrodes]EZG44085.1 hypothetical protein GNI_152570 [Gregarina niphandrodes]|eukprot:XP_011132812.1 hypothetical protein GNI_152570 [Gregarina niphandrodes]
MSRNSLLDLPRVLPDDRWRGLVGEERERTQRHVLELLASSDKGDIGAVLAMRKCLTLMRHTMEHKTDYEEEWLGTDGAKFYKQVIHGLSKWLLASFSVGEGEGPKDLLYGTILCQVLSNVLRTVLWVTDYKLWHVPEDYEALVRFIGFPVRPEWFLDSIGEKYRLSFRRNVNTGGKIFEEWYNSVIHLSHYCKVFWPVLGGQVLVERARRDVLERTSSRALAYMALFDKMVSSQFCFEILARAVKYAWATGQDDLFKPSARKTSTQNMSGAGAAAGISGNTENVPLGFTFLPKVCHILSRVGLKVPLAVNLSMLTKDVPSPMRSSSIIFTYLLVPKADNGSIPNGDLVWRILASLFTVLEPCSNPSVMLGKYDKSISHFLSYFLDCYVKRVGRERSWVCSTRVCEARKLGPVEDRVIIDMAFPLCREGIMKKSQDTSSRYDLALSLLCALSPTEITQWLHSKLLSVSENISEPLQLLVVLRLTARFSRWIALYSPSTILELFKLIENGSLIDVSEQMKTVALLTCFLSLSTFIPFSEFTNAEGEPEQADLYGVALEDSWKRLLFMFGAKTAENRTVFASQGKVTNIRNYPDCRLADTSSSRTANTNTGDETEQDECASYQTADNLRTMLEQRQLVSVSVGLFAETLVEKLLAAVDRMGSGSDALDDSLSNTIQLLFYAICTDGPTELVANLNGRFWQWAAATPRESVVKVIAAVAGGLAASRRVDALAIALDATEAVAARPAASPAILEWLLKLLRSTISIVDRRLLLRNTLRLARLSWKLLHSSEMKVFKNGTAVLAATIGKLMETEVRPWRPSSAYESPLDCLVNWLEPAGAFEQRCNKPVMEWDEPDDRALDTALALSTLFLELFTELQDRQTNPEAGRQFDAAKFVRELRGFIRNKDDALLTQLAALPTEPTGAAETSGEAGGGTELPEAPTVVFRLVRLVKVTVGSLSAVFVDEPSSRLWGATGAAHCGREAGETLLRLAVEFLSSHAAAYAGLAVDAESLSGRLDTEVVTQGQAGTDLSKLLQKMLGLVRVAAARQPPSQKDVEPLKTIEGWSTFGVWSNPLFGLHKYAALEGACPFAYLERVQQEWLYRVSCASERVRFSLDRRWCVCFVLAMTTCVYAQVRVAAQKLLGRLVACHAGARTPVIDALVAEWQLCATEPAIYEGADGAGDHGGAEAGPSVTPREGGSDAEEEGVDLRKFVKQLSGNHLAATSLAATTGLATKGLAATKGDSSIEESEASRAVSEYKIHRQMTGLIYVLGEPKMMRRIMAAPHWRNQVCMTLVDALSRPVEEASLRQRLLALARATVDCRSDCNAEDDRQFIRTLLDKLDEPLHWRSQTYCLALVTASLRADTLSQTTEGAKLVSRIVGWYVHYATQPSPTPNMVTLSLCGLSILGRLIVKHKEIVCDQETKDLLVQKIDKVLGNLSLVHVQITRNKDGNDLLYHLLVEVIRCDRSWPTSLLGKYHSGFSLHCCCISQTCVQLLRHFLGEEAALEILRTRVLPNTAQAWTAADKNSPSDEESYSTLAEFSAGLLRAARKWEPKNMKRIFELLVPSLKETIDGQNGDSNIWLDSMRWCVHGVFGGTKMKKRTMEDDLIDGKNFPNAKCFVFGVANAYINGRASTTELLPAVGDFDKSSLEWRRRMIFLATFHYDLNSIFSEEVEWTRNALTNTDGNLYQHKRARETLAHGLAQFILCCSSTLFVRLGRTDHPSIAVHEQFLKHFEDGLISKKDALLEALRHYRHNFQEDPAATSPDPETLEFMTLAQCLKHIFTHPARDALWPLAVPLMPVMLEARGYVELPDISGLGRAVSDLVYSNGTLAFVPQFRLPLLDVLLQSDNSKKSLYQLLELFIVKNSVTLGVIDMLNGSAGYDVEKLQSVLMEGLNKPSVSDYSEAAYAVLCAVMNQPERAKTAEQLLASAGNPLEVTTQQLGCLIALSVLITSCNNSYVPYWVPKTITQFARLGNSKAPDSCRKAVENCLQLFFQRYRADWETTHKLQFTERQLDLLSQYRGRPIYFG